MFHPTEIYGNHYLFISLWHTLIPRDADELQRKLQKDPENEPQGELQGQRQVPTQTTKPITETKSVQPRGTKAENVQAAVAVGRVVLDSGKFIYDIYTKNDAGMDISSSLSTKGFWIGTHIIAGILLLLAWGLPSSD